MVQLKLVVGTGSVVHLRKCSVCKEFVRSTTKRLHAKCEEFRRVRKEQRDRFMKCLAAIKDDMDRDRILTLYDRILHVQDILMLLKSIGRFNPADEARAGEIATMRAAFSPLLMQPPKKDQRRSP
jgi:hypothetical protein